MNVLPLKRSRSDRRLHGEDYRVLLMLDHWLDTVDFVPVSVPALAWDLYAKETRREVTDVEVCNVSRGLARLIELGYVERGAREGRFHTYRFVAEALANTGVSQRAA